MSASISANLTGLQISAQQGLLSLPAGQGTNLIGLQFSSAQGVLSAGMSAELIGTDIQAQLGVFSISGGEDLGDTFIGMGQGQLGAGVSVNLIGQSISSETGTISWPGQPIDSINDGTAGASVGSIRRIINFARSVDRSSAKRNHDSVGNQGSFDNHLVDRKVDSNYNNVDNDNNDKYIEFPPVLPNERIDTLKQLGAIDISLVGLNILAAEEEEAMAIVLCLFILQ